MWRLVLVVSNDIVNIDNENEESENVNVNLSDISNGSNMQKKVLNAMTKRKLLEKNHRILILMLFQCQEDLLV